MISFIILNEHSTIGLVKMLRQGRTKLLNTGYLIVLNSLFHQTSNLSFSFDNGNSELVTYFCISDEYLPRPRPLDQKVSKYGFKFKRFSCIKDDWHNHGSKAQKNLRPGFILNINCCSNICSAKLSVKIGCYVSLNFVFL